MTWIVMALVAVVLAALLIGKLVFEPPAPSQPSYQGKLELYPVPEADPGE